MAAASPEHSRRTAWGGQDARSLGGKPGLSPSRGLDPQRGAPAFGATGLGTGPAVSADSTLARLVPDSRPQHWLPGRVWGDLRIRGSCETSILRFWNCSFWSAFRFLGQPHPKRTAIVSRVPCVREAPRTEPGEGQQEKEGVPLQLATLKACFLDRKSVV